MGGNRHPPVSRKGSVGQCLISALALQLWFFMPAASVRRLLEILRAQVGSAGRGRTVADLFVKGVRPVLNRAQMEELKVRVVYQPPGYTVVILSVRVLLVGCPVRY